MGSEWPEHDLSEFVSIKHGFAFKGEFFKSEETADYLLTPGNFSVGGGFKGDKFKFYDGPVPEDYILQKNDLVVTMTDLSKEADTLGYSALVPEIKGHRLLHNQRVGLVEFKNDEVDKVYLYFLLRSREYRHHVLSGVTGTTVKHTSPTKILSYRFKKPQKKAQVKIGQYLLNIERKIQLNHQTNQTLEQMAQALFKSWFVDFDPVIDNALAAGNPIPPELQKRAHIRAQLRAEQGAQQATHPQAEASSAAPDNTKVLNGQLPQHLRELFPSEFEHNEALGWVPKGWEAGSLGSIATALSGYAFKSKDFLEYGEAVIKIKNINSTRGVDIKDVNRVSSRVASIAEKFLLNDGDIVMAMTGATVGKFGIVVSEDTEGYYLNQRVCKLASKSKNGNVFLYSALNNPGFEEGIVDAAQGSAQPNISASAILSRPMVVPSSEIIDLFISNMISTYKKRISLKKQDYKLEKLRDTLLPKLISGELRLPEGGIPSSSDKASA